MEKQFRATRQIQPQYAGRKEGTLITIIANRNSRKNRKILDRLGGPPLNFRAEQKSHT